MNKKLDQLFKNKLRGQQTAPPPAAWKKVQQQLNNKKQEKSFFYYKIASVCLLILISAVTFKLLNKEVEQSGKSDKVAVKITKPQKKEGNILKENSSNNDDSKAKIIVIEDEEDKIPLQQLAENEFNKKENVVLKKREKINNNAPETQSFVVEFEPEIEAKIDVLIVENKPEPENVPKENIAFPGIIITYKKGNPVNEETLNEKTADLAVVDKDNITVKKLIKFAKELKVSEINLADFRDSKEDLLSVDLKKIKN